MAEPFYAEIKIFPFNFAPRGWAFCNGQLIPISQNTALFSLLGTVYGGDGKSNFGLPDLNNSAALHPGEGPGLTTRYQGESGGQAELTLLLQEIPSHNHTALGNSGAGTSGNPASAVWSSPGADRDLFWYNAANPSVQMNPTASGIAGSSQPHNNLMPYLNLNFCIALQGLYPSRG